MDRVGLPERVGVVLRRILRTDRCSRIGVRRIPGIHLPLARTGIVRREMGYRRPTTEGADRAALRRRWAEMIRRVYEVDPLVCPRCGGEMRVVGFITQPALIKRILDHLRTRERVSRPPPNAPQPMASPV